MPDTLILAITPRFNDDLCSSDWDDVISCGNPEIAFNKFISKFDYLYDKNIPPIRHIHKSPNSRKTKSPWITKSLLKAIQRKNKLYCYYLSHPTIPNKTKYTKYKNILTTLLHSS